MLRTSAVNLSTTSLLIFSVSTALMYSYWALPSGTTPVADRDPKSEAIT
tara:strand:- start:89 stop:235 length:147 start_codon:yes stop_codon:yes gene_type:complete